MLAMSVFYMKCSVIVFLVFGAISPGHTLEYEILKIAADKEPDKVWDLSKLRVKRQKRGVYGFDGSIELLQTLDEKTKLIVKAFYSMNGVENYTPLPQHLNPGSACDFLNKEYKVYLKDLPKASDFPEIGDEYYCPLEKGVFKVNQYEWDPSKIQMPFRPGVYQFKLILEPAGGESSTLNIFVKVTAI